MMPLQTGILYGPQTSRRFGRSLGVNLLPSDQKLCSMQCVYCQYSETPLADQAHFPSLDRVQKALRAYLKKRGKKAKSLDWIMLCGNGEPTLYPEFRKAVDVIVHERNQWAPGVPVGILSNSTTCGRENIRKALTKLDGRFMKLDAGSEEMYKKANRPFSIFNWHEIVSGLERLPNVTLQSMFFEGHLSNTARGAVDAWIQVVKKIRPLEVQIYTVARQPQQTGIVPVSEKALQAIGKRLSEKTNIPFAVYV